ncbi:hypothetical protein X798_03701 [Onchocerca flexuosa]|uniref:Uncharacterized protein n=1 Tax=Onchocerca flexuosa TaxID=387005 RepID=A0A238BVH8_9BILA|nr:hypothetical protein X798_03701 [Onchocerca flexuosa]
MSEASSMTTISTTTTAKSNDVNGTRIDIIITIVLIVIVIFLICGYFGYRKIKERRRSHGEYRPQFEEYQHAKNLPYLQPPSIEGLI